MADTQDQGVVDLMKEALALYRKNARVFLITAAVLFVPGAFVSSCALSATLSPLAQSAAAIGDADQRVRERSEAFKRRAAQVKNRPVDAKVIAELAEENDRNWQEMSRANVQIVDLLKNGLMRVIRGLVGFAVLALILYLLVLPLTQGALTIAVADRLLGGDSTWGEHWTLLFRRKGAMLSAIVPAALIGVVGYFFLVLPGMVISCFLSFVAPVVIIEGLGGQAALKRSLSLVRSDWLRFALVVLTFGGLNTLALAVARLVVPSGNLFWSAFVGNLILLVVMPVPIILSVLLYLDIRRRNEGMTRERLAEELAALRVASPGG